jgi:hypothetical protein
MARGNYSNSMEMAHLMNSEVNRLYEILIQERTNGILAHDDAYPDVGMGMFPAYARKLAIARLKEEGTLPKDY